MNAAYNSTPLKWFGDSLVPARPTSNGTFLCITPTAVQAGVARRLRLLWSSAQLVGGVYVGENVSAVLLGSAAVRHAPHPWDAWGPDLSSVLVLTQSELAQTGSVVLTAMDDLRPIRAPRGLPRAPARRVRPGRRGQAAARRLSFVFGPMPSSPFGELGDNVGCECRCSRACASASR